jgi:hypothetical protein
MRTPYQLLLILLPLTFWKSVVEQTNKYAADHIAQHGPQDWGDGRTWVPVTLQELVVWIGICMGMAWTGLRRTSQYWWTEKRGLIAFPGFGAIMGQTRWEQIKKYFHLNDNKIRPPNKQTKEYRLWHVLPMINTLNSTSKLLWRLGQNVVVDERTIPSRHSRAPIRIYNPSKPYKFGFELFSICCCKTYYCWHFIVYDKLPQPGLHSLVVMNLASTLVYKGHIIFLDRGFTSPALIHWLGKQGHGASGTVVCNRKGFPKDLKLGARDVQGTMKAQVSVTHKLLAMTWKDKKDVPFVTNCHKGLGAETQRQVGSERVRVTCPEVAVEYNANKAGVDQFDKLCLSDNMSTEREIISHKWWTRLFWGLLDGAAANAYIVWKQFHPEKECTRDEFMLQLHEGLLGNSLDTVVLEPGRKKANSGQGQGRLDGVGHLVDKIPNIKAAQKCRLCRFDNLGTGNDPRRSKFWCTKCRVPLCIDKCFLRFHQEPLPGLKVGVLSQE